LLYVASGDPAKEDRAEELTRPLICWPITAWTRQPSRLCYTKDVFPRGGVEKAS
jgi:hypothetical protein